MLVHVRLMRRFLNEVIETDPELRPHYARLDVAYAELLQQELAPHAYSLAIMLVALEDAYSPADEAQREE